MLFQIAQFTSISLNRRCISSQMPLITDLLRGRCNLCPCVAYKQAKISNKCAECCCPSSVHVNKGTLFTIFFLADISDDNKHLAFEVTIEVAFS